MEDGWIDIRLRQCMDRIDALERKVIDLDTELEQVADFLVLIERQSKIILRYVDKLKDLEGYGK